MDDIRVDVGVYTALEVDLTEFDFTGISKLIMTVKNKLAPGMLFQREFDDSTTYNIEITPEESKLLRVDAEYDFTIVTTDGKRFKNGDNGKIILRKGCWVCNESQ